MKAAVTTRFGPPEMVEVREVPTPTPASNEVLVRVRASSVCFGDRMLRQGAQDFTAGGSVYDVIVDVLGKAGFPRSLRASKHGGRYLLVGFAGGLWGITRALVAGGVAHLLGRARFITGAADPKQGDLVFLRELIDAGKLRTVISRRYTLDEIREAHRYADTGHKVGHVAVLIGDRAEH